MQNSPDNIRAQVSQLLLQHYSCLNPEFQYEQCNYEMLDTFYNVIGDSELMNLFGEIEPYIDRHSTVLKYIIRINTENFIFNQPAYLFVYFSLWHWNNKIINGWPYDFDSLLAVVTWSGYTSSIVYGA